jgi:hypothetical protein
MDRREFLTGSVGALIGAGAGAAAAAPTDAETPLLPFYDHALLADTEAADVVIIRRTVEEELATGDGLTLAFRRYDREGMSRPCGVSVILSKAQILSGFYVRGAVPFKLRVIVDDEEPGALGLVLRVVLRECARVRVYTETAHGRVGASGQPMWVDQIVVVTDRLDRTPA